MNPALRLALRISLLLLIVSPLVHMLKVARLGFDPSAFVFYAGFPLVVLLTIFGGLFEPNNTSKRPPLFIALVLFMTLWAALMTFVHQGVFTDIGGNILRLLLVFSFVFFLTNAGELYTRFMNARLAWVAKASLVTSFVATLIMHLAALVGFVVYFGLQTTAAFVSLGYALVYQRLWLVLLSLVPLLGAGKRGTMMGAVVLLFLYFAVAAGRIRLHRVVSMATVIFGLLAILFIFQLLPEAILARVNFLFAPDDFDVNMITSGRITEVTAALDKLNATPLAWLTGFGFGSTIEITGSYGSLNISGSLQESTVHFSPLGMVMIFGLPLTAVFYSVLFYYMVLFFRYCRAGWVSREFVVLYLVFVAEFVFSFTAFTLLQSTLMWLAFAYLVVNSRTSAAPSATPLLQPRPLPGTFVRT